MSAIKKAMAGLCMIASISVAFAASEEGSEQKKFITQIDKKIEQEGKREIQELQNQAAKSSDSIENSSGPFETHSGSQGITQLATGGALKSQSQDAMEKAESALSVAQDSKSTGVMTQSRSEATTGSTCTESGTRTVYCGSQGCGSGSGKASYSYTESYCKTNKSYKHVDVYEDVYIESENNNTYKVGSNFVRDYCAYGDCP